MAKILVDIFDGNYPITQRYGENPERYARFGLNGHDGVDWGMPEGTIIRSAVNGQVTGIAEDPNGYGKYILVTDLAQNIQLIYAHLSQVSVNLWQTVAAGQEIGKSGNTGYSTGPHLHFALRLVGAGGSPIYNPNGKGGWLDPLASGIDWITENRSTFPPETSTIPATPSTPTALTFEQAYPVLYKGWDEASARANFAVTGGKDKAGYEQLVGLPAPTSTGASTPPPRPINPFDPLKWYVKPQFAGMRLKDMGEVLGNRTREDLLAGFLGVNEFYEFPGDLVLSTKGFPSNYIPNSGEFIWFLKAFTNTPPMAPNPPAPPPKEPEKPIPVVTGQPPATVDRPIEPVPQPPPAVVPPPSTVDLSTVIAKLDQIISILGSVSQETPQVTPPVVVTTQKGYVYIISNPSRASITIDGAHVSDYTPFNQPYQYPVGNHTIKVTKKGYKTIEEVIQVTANQQLTITYTLEPIATL